MSHHTSKEKRKVKLFSGLGRTLGISFLVLALVPLTMVSMISYEKAHESLEQEVRKGLESIAWLKTREIRTYFDNMRSQLRFQSETDSNAKLLEELVHAHKAFGKPLADFVKSVKWTRIVDNMAGDIISFRRSFNYYDIFLVSQNGDILYTVAGESDLGTNLFAVDYKATRFADACKRTIKTGKEAFSDYEKYGPSKNRVYGFLTAPIVNQEGDRIGAMAFQFKIDPITRIIEKGLSLGKTAETYMVGPDLTLRSGLARDKEKALIEEKIETEQTALLKQHMKTELTPETAQHAFLYDGPHGQPVLGIHQGFMIGDISFGVIAEIDESEAFSAVSELRYMMIFMVVLTALMVIVFAIILVRRIVRPVIQLSSGTKRVEKGDYSGLAEIKSRNEIGDLGRSFNTMTEVLKKNQDENNHREWFQGGQMELNMVMRGKQDLGGLSRNIITFLAKYLEANIGAIYIVQKNNELRKTESLKLTGSYAFSTRKHLSNEFDFGQGLVGQAALEKERILLTQVPEDYIAIRSGLGETTPRAIVVKPVIRNERVIGVIELGALDVFSESALKFLDLVSEQIAVGIQTALSHIQVQELLEQSQAQGEQLQTQQEELRVSNEELEEQAQALKKSEATLQAQQEELRETNEHLEKSAAELEEQASILETQKAKIERQNRTLESAQKAVEQKAEDLRISGKYKSEFLANMSHELRTPLNSILILSKLLADNSDGNLTEKQANWASTVNSSGTDLLELINEVLDLSKVEAGRMEVNSQDILLTDLAKTFEQTFLPVTQDKGLSLNFSVADDLPESIYSDRQRVEQIIKNFLSNAIKFTEEGGVTLKIHRPENNVNLSISGLNPKKAIAFSVVDTGIGVPLDKQKTIFEAFQQVDGTTSRKFGGTGLGLSISRGFSMLLGGEIQMQSSNNNGATFTLFLPESYEKPEADTCSTPVESIPEIPTPSRRPERLAHYEKDEALEPQEGTDKIYVRDDRKDITPDDKTILIIEDDPNFAEILGDISREKGFRILVAENGETGLHFVDYYKPSAIILDIGLPGMDGWAVMSRLKENMDTRHIPVHFVSASDKNQDAMKMGAIGFLEKPANMGSIAQALDKIKDVVSRPVKELLVIEDDATQQAVIANIIGNGDVTITMAGSGSEAYDLLKSKHFDCIVLDLGLPDMDGKDLLDKIKGNEDLQNIPVIIHTANDMSRNEEQALAQYADKIVIKTPNSNAKLLDETTLFLHRVEANLPEEKRELLKLVHDKEQILKDKKILLVDDDMRNVFALSAILEEKVDGVYVGKNGKEALDQLDKYPDIDLVLMDIMMPEMDGYEAMEKIREQDKFEKLPIIALTAKAMKGDKAKCIDAGADDYLAKPVDTEKLMSMLRVWLY